MNSRRFTAGYLPCFGTKENCTQGTAALRDFEPIDVADGSTSVIAMPSAARPLFHRKRKSTRDLAMSRNAARYRNAPHQTVKQPVLGRNSILVDKDHIFFDAMFSVNSINFLRSGRPCVK